MGLVLIGTSGVCYLLSDGACDSEMDKEEIKDTLHSVRNRIRITEFILDDAAMPFIMEVLPTLLEDCFEDIQELVDKYCVDIATAS